MWKFATSLDEKAHHMARKILTRSALWLVPWSRGERKFMGSNSLETTMKHNPDNVEPGEGYRLLDEDEVDDKFDSCLATDKIQKYMRHGFWSDGWWGSAKEFTYRTRLSRAELRAARGLPPEDSKPEEKAQASDTPATYGPKHFMYGSCACHGQVEAIQKQLTAVLARVEAAEAELSGEKARVEVREAWIVDLEKDQERLDWMSKMRDDCEGWILTRCFAPSDESLREAIDAQMQPKETQ